MLLYVTKLIIFVKPKNNKMKKIIFKVIITLLFTQFSKAQNITFDIDKSSIIWTGKNIVNKSHYGSLSFVEADIKFDNSGDISGFFKVDLNSLNVLDLQGDWKKNLEGHLKSDDFFAVDKFRYATLELLSSSLNDDYYLVEGNITIKGITKSVSFKMYKNDNNFKVSMVFDRSDFNVKYGSGKFFENLGDNMILDQVELVIELVKS